MGPLPGRAAPARDAGAASPAARQAAFTLMEMMTALAVFGVIGLMATQILTGTIRLGEATRDRGDALADLQRAVAIIGRDVMQLTRRGVKDELGEDAAPVTIAGNSLLELTRLGWQNPLGMPRGEVQRVAYVLRDTTLVRLYWAFPDRAPGSEPIAQVLLRDVAEADFAAYDNHGERHGFWPPTASEGVPAPEIEAVAMSLRLERHGHIERLWLVARSATNLASEKSGDRDARGHEDRS